MVFDWQNLYLSLNRGITKKCILMVKKKKTFIYDIHLAGGTHLQSDKPAARRDKFIRQDIFIAMSMMLHQYWVNIDIFANICLTSVTSRYRQSWYNIGTIQYISQFYNNGLNMIMYNFTQYSSFLTLFLCLTSQSSLYFKSILNKNKSCILNYVQTNRRCLD